jgi:Tol biopolymer transport system component
MQTIHYNRTASCLSIAMFICACSDSPDPVDPIVTPAKTVSLAVTVVTTSTSDNVDEDGYTISVDQGAPMTIADRGTVTIPGLATGRHLVLLGGVAQNCEILGGNPLPIMAKEAPLQLSFYVTCYDKGGPCLGCPDSRLLYVRSVGTDAEIYVTSYRGKTSERLTNRDGWDGDPAWSPDHTKIVFASDRDGNLELYVMDADGKNPVRITNDPAADYSPAWSPDGSRIAFVSKRGGNPLIFVMDADGSNPVRLTNGFYDIDPAWSPSGKQIAFSHAEAGYATLGSGIYVMQADGSGLQQLTHGYYPDLQPAWSPDGRSIAFNQTSYYPSCIAVMNADGTLVRQLSGNLSYVSDPAWSPDGGYVAFASLASGFYGADSKILVVHADGSSSPDFNVLTSAFTPAWR